MNRSVAGLPLLIALLVAFALSLTAYDPPPPRGPDAPATVFSATRALQHLDIIAARPHPVGSAAHAAVRGYLIARLEQLGLTVHVQSDTVLKRHRSGVHRLAVVRNVVAQLPGRSSHGAILLLAHYDARDHAPGAGDDGAGVAAILEGLRVLGSGAPLQSDLIVLFSDAEEIGLLGAKAFLDRHPWRDSLLVAINLEARGASGPSLLFETSAGNLRLIEAVATAPDPVALSVATAIYRSMPNDTDLSEFLAYGVPGLNFSFSNELARYHSSEDRVENLSRASLQHHGEWLVALVHALDGRNPEALASSQDAAFFPFPGLGLIHHPQQWSALIVGGLLLLAAVVVSRLRRHRRISLLRTVGYALLLMLIPVVVYGVVALVQTVIARQFLAGTKGWLLLYYDELVLSAALLVALALTDLLVFPLTRRRGPLPALAGLVLLLVILSIATAILAPAGYYYAAIPLLSATLLLALEKVPAPNSSPGPLRLILQTLVVFPTIAVLFPGIVMTYHTFGPPGLPMVAALFGLLWTMLLPLDGHLRRSMGSWLPASAALIAVVLMASVVFGKDFTADNPRPSSLSYALDLDDGAGFWLSHQDRSDPWTERFVDSGEDTRAVWGRFFPGTDHGGQVGRAPALPLAGPRLSRLEAMDSDSGTTVRFRIAPADSGAALLLTVPPVPPVWDLTVAGRSVAIGGDSSWTTVVCYGLDTTGVPVSLTTAPSATPVARLVERRLGMAPVPVLREHPRPGNFMPFPNRLSDMTLIARSTPLRHE